MADRLPPDNPDREHVPSADASRSIHDQVRFEGQEITLRGILGVLVAIALVFGGVGGVAWRFLQSKNVPMARPPASPQYRMPSESLPAEPRLEPLMEVMGDRSANVFARQLAKEQVLHSYGTTPDEDYVHIPIKTAMKIAVERLPTQQTSSSHEKSYGLQGGGESNSGRLFQGAPSWYGR